MVVDVTGEDGAPVELEPGATVEVRDVKSSARGWAVYNGFSRIRARVFGRGDFSGIWDGGMAARLLGDALDRRRALDGALPHAGARGAYRLCFGEADFLPGLVVDVFAGVAVLQVNTVAAERVLGAVAPAVAALSGVGRILVRRDSPQREFEGLPVVEAVTEFPVERGGAYGQVEQAIGASERPVEVEMDSGEVLLADLVSGQKTGLFLDQRLNRLAVGEFFRGGDVLDMHCHVGGWALSAAAQGARRVVGVDRSAAAIDLARQAAGLPANRRFNATVQFEQGDDLEWMRAAAAAGRQFDVVVVDPPALAKAARHVPGALRNHGALARAALAILRPGGVLVQCCCSQAITPAQLEEAMAEALARSGMVGHLIKRLSQPPDHPVLSGHPPSEYLKGVVMRVAGGPARLRHL